MKHTEEHYRLFFGKQDDFYLEIAEELDSGRKAFFNLHALIYNVFWMLYRKMYGWSFLMIILIAIVGVAGEFIARETSFFDGGGETKVPLVLLSLFPGFYASRLYVKMADKKISKVLALQLPDEEANERIRRAGGTTIVPHMLLVALIVFLALMVDRGHLG